VLFPRQAYHDVEAMPARGVQEPARRHGVGANRVQAVGRHSGEVPLDGARFGVVISVRTGAKRSVGDAADVELILA
jgi:hypothetical protein